MLDPACVGKYLWSECRGAGAGGTGRDAEAMEMIICKRDRLESVSGSHSMWYLLYLERLLYQIK